MGVNMNFLARRGAKLLGIFAGRAKTPKRNKNK
jgi:hypothetical protein